MNWIVNRYKQQSNIQAAEIEEIHGHQIDFLLFGKIEYPKYGKKTQYSRYQT